MKKKCALAIGLALMAIVATNVQPATAATITFDFTSLGSNNTPLASSVTVNGVTAEGFATSLANPATLWLRNVTNDHGLGVCSEGQSSCSSGGGDVNELDNAGLSEFIRLTRPDNFAWSSLWVSSLDSGGTGGSEEGQLFWSNTPTGFSAANSVKFMYPETGSTVEFDLLTIAAVSSVLDKNAKYLLFAHPGAFSTATSGDNNDYLVWKGAVTGPDEGREVPEPGTLALLGLGLAGLAATRRRKQ